MPQSISTATANVGFITALSEAGAYAGGYLVTNEWGRPLEFRVSARVMPTRVQRILYGETLEPYVLADLIGRILLNRTATTVSWLLTDQRAFLELRAEIDTPVAWVTNDVGPREGLPPVLRVPYSGTVASTATTAFQTTSSPFSRIWLVVDSTCLSLLNASSLPSRNRSGSVPPTTRARKHEPA